MDIGSRARDSDVFSEVNVLVLVYLASVLWLHYNISCLVI